MGRDRLHLSFAGRHVGAPVREHTSHAYASNTTHYKALVAVLVPCPTHARPSPDPRPTLAHSTHARPSPDPRPTHARPSPDPRPIHTRPSPDPRPPDPRPLDPCPTLARPTSDPRPSLARPEYGNKHEALQKKRVIKQQIHPMRTKHTRTRMPDTEQDPRTIASCAPCLPSSSCTGCPSQ